MVDTPKIDVHPKHITEALDSESSPYSGRKWTDMEVISWYDEFPKESEVMVQGESGVFKVKGLWVGPRTGVVSVMVLDGTGGFRAFKPERIYKKGSVMAVTEAKKAPKRTKQPRKCECDCGELTGGGRFLPGHDAKLKSRMQKAYRAATRKPDRVKLEKEFHARGWGHFIPDLEAEAVKAEKTKAKNAERLAKLKAEGGKAKPKGAAARAKAKAKAAPVADEPEDDEDPFGDM